MTQNALVPVPLLREVAEYLAARPYREVAGLLQAIQQCQPAPEPEAESEAPDAQ